MILKFFIAKQILKKSDELEITLQRSSSFDGPLFLDRPDRAIKK